MCTSIIELVRSEGMAKGADEWFTLTDAAVAYDHARHALLGDVITIDFSRFAGMSQVGDASRGTFLLAFTMGAVAALLAGRALEARAKGRVQKSRSV